MKVRSLASAAVLIVTLGAPPALGGSAWVDPAGAAEALERDAGRYSEEFDVPVREAKERLALQEAIGAIGAAVAEGEATTYAGHWIRHEPTFGVVFAFTEDGADTLARYVSGTPLEGIVGVVAAQHAYEALQATLDRLVADVQTRVDVGDVMPFTAAIDVTENVIVISTRSIDELDDYLGRHSISLPEAARVVEVAHLPQPSADLYGGRPLTTCTSGFSVYDIVSLKRGILTAGHCNNSQSWLDTNPDQVLTFEFEEVGYGNDTQMHTRAGATIRNWAWDGNPSWRWITGKRPRANQSVGDYVCKFGKTTGYGCGNITTKSSIGCVPNSIATYIRVHNSQGQDLSNGGDSGGPWYTAETALGTMSCQDGVDAIYVAEDYTEGALGVRIMTAP